MTTEHTPGPWAARRMHTGGFDIFDARNRDVVTVYGGGVETESREANARLIAAAPDMLEVLISTRDSLQAMADEGIIAEGSWPTIDAAILKATGQ